MTSKEKALLFPATHHMLRGESVLRREGFELRLVPAPPGSGQVCSTAIALPERSLRAALELLERNGVEVRAAVPCGGWREGLTAGFIGAAAREAEELGCPQGFVVALKTMARGERPNKEVLRRLLEANPRESELLQRAAGELARGLRGGRAVPMVAVRTAILRKKGFGGLIGEMSEAGLAYLLLVVGEGETSSWQEEDFRGVAGEGVVLAVDARTHAAEAAAMMKRFGAKQVLMGAGQARHLPPEEAAEAVSFLLDNPARPVGSGVLLPLLDEEAPEAGSEEDSRCRLIASVLRLALADAFIPAPPSSWRKGLPEGADMPLLLAEGGPLREAVEEAEEALRRQGWTLVGSAR